MGAPASLSDFVGNERAVQILKRAIAQDRLPHAMIFAGPSGVGKCTLALLVAQYLNCVSPAAEGACGQCSACARIMAALESRYLECQTLKGGFCGTCANCRIRTRRHPDIRLVEPEKTTISIDQVRELINEIAFQPLEARYRVVILDPAEQMRLEAHNSLLKTLEEPPSRTVIILVTTNPYMLLGTIRSRARLLQFGEIAREKIARRLVEREGRAKDEARLAAALSGGSLAAALEFNTTEYREIRTQALEFVSLLLGRGRFADVSKLAVQVTKDKQLFPRWLESVSALLQDVYYVGVASERVGQGDLIDELSRLAVIAARPAQVHAIKAVERLKRELHYNVNRQLALEALFVDTTLLADCRT